jgi:hypothetical protein
MPRSRALALKAVITIVVLGAVPALLPPPAPAGSGPYSSALTVSATGQALAAATCNDKACAGGSRHNIVCAKVVGFHCQNLPGRFCTSGAC